MKPILFNTEMVRAIQEGRKTVTRRVGREIGLFEEPIQNSIDAVRGTFAVAGINPDNGERQYMVERPCRTVPGDILWVRETWWKNYGHKYGTYFYRADGEEIDIPLITGGTRKHGKADGLKWRPSIHMPKEAARLFLRVKGVRVERLLDITEEQAIMEGIFLDSPDFIPTYHYDKSKCNMPGRGWNTARECFLWGVWNGTIKPADLPLYGWEANPWVWVIEFERISKEAALGGGGDG